MRIRAIRPTDRAALERGFRELSPASVYFRFLGVKRELGPEELTRLTEVDFVRHVALVAELPSEGEPVPLGVGRYIMCEEPEKRGHADLAITVAEEHQGLGVGTVLLQQLVHVARESGVEVLEADVMRANQRMLDVLMRSGLPLERRTERESVHFSVHLRDPPEEPG